jgi:hypothetical protein
MSALADFLFECGRHEEGSGLARFISGLVGKRNIATELTKASVLLRQAGRLETASEMFASALDHSWPKERH